MLLLSFCRYFFFSRSLTRSLSLSKLKHFDCLSAAEVRGQANSWTWVCEMDGAGAATGASYITRRQPQTLSIKQVTVLRIIHSPLCWSGQGDGVLQLILACNYLLLKTAGLVLFACTCMAENTHGVWRSWLRKTLLWWALKPDIKRVHVSQSSKKTR